MGAGCSHNMDALAHLATAEEVREAVRSIEAWTRAQEQNKGGGANFQHAGDTKSPLLYRVGGSDTVRRVVEGFYRRLYADEKMQVFLQDRDISYLRAKQSAFMSWLFGPSNIPYSGKHLRTVHLKLIKQRGFSAEVFETGMQYFIEAMHELGAPEVIINEVMAKIRPFKDVIFTPSLKDAEEEARWAVEERLKDAAATAAAAAGAAKGTPPQPQQASGQPGASTQPAAAAAVEGDRPASSRARQCPFSGARLSRPTSAAVPSPVAPAAPVAAAATATAFSAPTAGSDALGPAAAAASAAVPAAAAARATPAAAALAPAAASTSDPSQEASAAASPSSPQRSASPPSSSRGGDGNRPLSATPSGGGRAAAPAVALAAAASSPVAAEATAVPVPPVQTVADEVDDEDLVDAFLSEAAAAEAGSMAQALSSGMKEAAVAAAVGSSMGPGADSGEEGAEGVEAAEDEAVPQLPPASLSEALGQLQISQQLGEVF